jgi:uncharacterized protein (DUF302 family)
MTTIHEDFTTHRVEYSSSRSFEAIVAEFDAVTGALPEGLLNAEIAISENAQDFERRIRSYEGSSGFTRFLTIEHGSLLEFFGNASKARVYAIGNPLWAVAMLWHNTAVAIDIPTRLAIYESTNGEVRLAYDLPSSIVKRLNDPALTKLALSLDAKLAALAERVT